MILILFFVFDDFCLSRSEVTVLNKGIKYCPQVKPNISNLIQSSSSICRKLKLVNYHNRQSINSHESTYKSIIECSNPKADIQNSNNYLLDICLNKITDELINSTVSTKNNKYSEESVAKNLSKRLRINKFTICKSDKGNNFVILPVKNYDELVMAHLNDSNTYVECSENLLKDIHYMIVTLCKQERKCLTYKEFNYLNSPDWKASNFYVLPKLHKCAELQTSGIIKDGYTYLTTVPPGLTSRPIVNSVDSVTSKLNELMDAILKPYISLIPSYIQDSFDFLKKLPKTLKPNDMFISWDIVSLYTKIPNSLGLEAIKFWLQFSLHEERFKENFILGSMAILLNYNTFQYKNKYFQQISGVAMGSKVSPIYAILTIAYLEIKFYNLCMCEFGEDIGFYIKNNFYRYIDDCFLIWNPDFGSINILNNIINSLNENIVFQMNCDTKSLPFLDILVYRDGDCLHTDIYKKPTDSNIILSFRSHHPRHTLRNIPYCLAKRICTIVTNNSVRKHRLEELKKKLIMYNYPLQLVEDAISKNYSVQTIRVRNNNTRVLPLVFTFHKNFLHTVVKIKSHVANLSLDEQTKHITKDNNIILSYKSSPKTINLLQYRQPTIKKCLRSRCKTCLIILEGNQILLPNRLPLLPNITMNCTSKYVVYCLICAKCNNLYIGQTSLSLCNRITLHRQHTNHVSNYASLKCNKHFHKCGGKFYVAPLFSINKNPTLSQLLFIESFFIKLLKPELNA